MSINSVQSVPFEIYAEFECNLRSAKSYEGSKYQDHIPCNFAYKLVCVDDKSIFVLEVKMLLINLLKK